MFIIMKFLCDYFCVNEEKHELKKSTVKRNLIPINNLMIINH